MNTGIQKELDSRLRGNDKASMGNAEQLDFFEQNPEDEKRRVVPETDNSKFKFAKMREEVGGEAPPPDGLELQQTSKTREENETITARRKFAGKE